jgi:hypothetical protein
VVRVKIFKFSKENNYGNHEDLVEVKITKEKKFKSVVLSNPKDSNCIYIIDKITLLNKFTLSGSKISEVKFYSYDDFKSVDSDISYGSLGIKFKVHETENSDKLLLHKAKMEQATANSLMAEEYFLVLPGGALSIEFPSEEKDISLRLLLGKEML